MTYFWHSCNSQTCMGLSQMSGQQRFRLGVMLGAIGLFAIVEWLAGYWSHSLALRSDAWHMVADAGAILLALSASWLMRLAFVRRLPGKPRLDAIAAFLNSLALILMAGLIATEAIQHLIEPPQQILSGPMFVTAALGLAINAIGIVMLHEDSKNNLNVRGAFLHMLADLVSSVGIMFAALAIYLFQCFWLDGAIGLLISLFIAQSAIPLLKLSREQWNKQSLPFNSLMMPEIGRTNIADLIVDTKNTDSEKQTSQ
ncbi:MAG: cation transporter [Hormoscilla sp. SP5CHS1]|nr:cation transporter [Hormoscilla sp. SP12CHS1]MBC6455189.1 cation transporter [Hormoscilla sp. SP5CHS1]